MTFTLSDKQARELADSVIENENFKESVRMLMQFGRGSIHLVCPIGVCVSFQSPDYVEKCVAQALHDVTGMSEINCSEWLRKRLKETSRQHREFFKVFQQYCVDIHSFLCAAFPPHDWINEDEDRRKMLAIHERHYWPGPLGFRLFMYISEYMSVNSPRVTDCGSEMPESAVDEIDL